MTNPTYRYNVYLYNFNNYYNRQLKYFATVNEYNEWLITSYNANVDVKDMLKTSIIVNYATGLATPNYLILEDTLNLNKLSRWFVIEAVQVRGQQYKLNLKRDVIADYYATIKTSPCLLYKGYVNNDNVLIFNKEQQEYNKKKMYEYLIKDPEDTGFVVGFIGKDKDYVGDINTTYSAGMQTNFDYDSLSQTMKNYFAIGSQTPTSTAEDRTRSTIVVNSVGLQVTSGVHNQGDFYANNVGKIPLYRNLTDSDYNTTIVFSRNTKPDCHLIYTQSRRNAYDYEWTPSADTARDDLIKPIYEKMRTVMTSKLNNQDINYDVVLDVDRSFINNLQSYNNKICCINNVYYKCEFMKVANGTGSKTNDNYSFTANIRNSLPTSSDMSGISGFSNNFTNYQDNFTTSDIDITYLKYKCYIKLTQQTTAIKTKLTSKSSRNHLIDAPYDMFVMPYSDTYSYVVGGTVHTANKNMAINLAQGICESTGSNSVYDIQIVPYCPFDITNHNWSGINKEEIKNSSNQIIGYYFWADKSSKQIEIAETRSRLTLSGTQDYKEITQTRKYILCSPDKHDQWEFNPCMNYGVDKWIITYDYRPFQSYMKIQPEFKYNSLYGQTSFNDQYDLRGLLINCGYSLTQLNDAWATYVSNNKNYQDIFDTQINSQIKVNDLQNKAAWDTMFQRSFDIGFMGLGMITSPLKAEANTKEQIMNEQVQHITLEAQRKTFNYQLDNIKNQPDTIRKLTSLNQDFRIWPFVEIYECSNQELQIYRDMIKYNGMTLMVTGYIDNYLKPGDETFIQGNLIRFEEFEDQENDFTLVQEINDELNKGIYITKENS